MKKIILTSLIVVFILSMGILSFAESDLTESPEWFNEMIQWKKERIQEAVDSHLITENEASLWNERLESMEEFHREKGFNFPNGCGGSGFKRGTGRGFRGAMGRGWNNAY